MKISIHYFRLLLPALLMMLISGMARSSWAVTPQIRSGVDHSVQLRSDGTIWATGSNWTGQLGDGTTLRRSAPVQVGLPYNSTNWVAIAAGDEHTLALQADGSLWAWGANQAGQLGNNSTLSKMQPVQIGSGNDWIAVAAGGSSSFALKANGELWAWGGNASGQLGLGSTDASPHGSPVKVGTASNWKAVSAGEFHTLALKADGTLWAWGDNTRGQLGNNSISNLNQPVRIDAKANDWTAVAAGGSSSFAMKVDGTLWAWGLNDYGQLGIGSADGAAHMSPVKVSNDRDWAAISVGNLHVLAVRRNGSLWAWGDNTSGQLGDGTRTNLYLPYRITAPTDIVAVAAGAFHSVALKANGEIYAWGDNGSGQLGRGGDIGSSLALLVGTDEPVWVSTEPGGEFTVSRRSNGTLWAWGDNSKGQLGDNTLDSHSAPAMVGTATNWVAHSAGWSHTVALQADGSLWTWGNNSKGQLGNGTTTILKTPTRITTANDWTAISAGDFHTLALKRDGTLWAWGENTKGQLGNNTTDNLKSPAQIITGNPGNFDKQWVVIAAGGSHSLALHADGTLWGWGNNVSKQIGDLGDPDISVTKINKPHQIAIAKLSDLPAPGWNSNWVAIAAGLNHSLALQADGTLWSWGNNFSGQLGDGKTATSSAPVQVGLPDNTVNPHIPDNSSNWRSIAAGDSYSAARRADGTLWSWGNNTSGQLGTGPHPTDLDPLHPQAHTTPVQELSRASDWADAGSGGGHTVAPKASGSLWAWGNNTKGELGDNTVNTRSTPSPLMEGHIGVTAAVAFNDVAIGTVPVQAVSISNNGTGPLAVTDLTIGGTDTARFSAVTETCGALPFTVKPSGSCTIVIAFNPALPAEAKSATLTISSSDPTNLISALSLSGTAVVPVTVTTSVSPPGSGTISPNGTDGSVLVIPGSGQLFSIMPTTGFHVVDVLVNGNSKGAVSSLILPAINTGTTISASFAVNYYTVTMTSGANGSITGPSDLKHGDRPTYTISVTTAGYHVADVTVDGKSLGAVTTVTLPALLANTEIKATFAIDTYQITKSPGANGTINGPTTVNFGDTPVYAIVASDGYHVVDVKVDGVSMGAVTSLTLPAVSAAKTITASFAFTDIIPSVTTAIPNPGTYTDRVTITLSTTEPGSTIYYTIDGSPVTTASPVYTGPFALTAAIPSQKVQFFSVDAAGNVETIKNAIYTMQDNALVGSVKINNGALQTKSASVALALVANDSTGVPQMQVACDGVTFAAAEPFSATRNCVLPSGDGAKTVAVKFIDGLGIVYPQVTAAIMLDTTPPDAAATPIAGDYSGAVKVTLTATEAGSTIYYTTDGTPVTTASPVYSAPINLTAATTTSFTVRFMAVDKAGNAGPVADAAYTIHVGISNGDLNGDGKVDISDALKALQMTIGLYSPTMDDMIHGDVAPLVNGKPVPNGKIDLVDTLFILQRSLGLLTW